MDRRTRLALLAVAALAVGSTGCAELLRALRGGLRTPTAAYQKAELDAITLDDATVAATFEIDNPNPIGLSLAGVDWAFSLEAQKLFDGRVQGGLRLPPNGKSTLRVPVRIPYQAVPGLVTTLATKNEAPYTVEGRVHVDTPIGPVSLPIKWTGMLPIPKLPQVSFAAARVENLSFTGARVLVTLDVKNPNVFELPLKTLSGNLLVSDMNVARLGLNASKPLAAGRSTAVQLPVEISFASAGMAVSSAIASRSALVKLNGEANFGGKVVPLNLATTLR